MPKSLPRVFLDTQIPAQVVSGQIDASEWRLVAGYLGKRARYCISALTLGELLLAMTKASPEYFSHHRSRFQALLQPNPQAEFLDFAPYFAGNVIGWPTNKAIQLETDFRNLAMIVLSAPSAIAIRDGFHVPWLAPNQEVKLNLDKLARELQIKKEGYLQTMLSRRRDAVGDIPISIWCSALLGFYGLAPTPELLAEAEHRFSAAYEFEVSTNKLGLNMNFPLEKKLSDLVDGQQLLYLCDPQMIFVTNDVKLRNRISKSPQQKRILGYKDLLVAANQDSSFLPTH